MSVIINLTDKLRIRRVDVLNVTVEKLVRNKKTDIDEWVNYNGSGRGPYCSSEQDACVWVLKHGLVDEGGETDLKEAIKGYEKAARTLARSVSKALESANVD